jgi:exonuclease SbcC
MLVEQISLEGFLSYKNKQTIDLSNVSTCLVLGRLNGDIELSNGAGKSSLFESIPVNFFGKGSGRADLLDSYINDDMSKMYLETIFKIDNQRFKVERTKTRAAGTIFEIFQDSTNKSLDKATWKKTDKTIEEILGLSAKTFSSTIYLNERESLQVITGTSSERKEILRELLNIEIYEKAAKICNKKSDEFDRKILVNIDLIKNRQEQLEQEPQLKKNLLIIETELKDMKKELKNQEKLLKEKNEEKKKVEITIETQKSIKEQIVQVQKMIDEFDKQKRLIEKDIYTTNEEIKTQKKSYSSFKTSVEDSLKSIPDLKTTIKKHETKLKELEEKEKELKDILKQIRLQTEQKGKLSTSLGIEVSTSKQIENYLERINEFENICPVTDLQCPVLKDDYKNDLKNKKEEELKKITITIDDLKKQVELTTKEIQILSQKQNDLENQLETRQDLNEELSNYKLSLQSAESNKTKLIEKEKEFDEYLKLSEKDIEELQQKIVENQKQLKENEEKKKELKESLNQELDVELKKISDLVLTIEKEVVEIRTEFDTKNQQLGETKSSLDKLEEMRSEIEVFIKNNEENAKQKQIYHILNTVFGKDGIQKAIIKESIPMLEQYTSEFLSIFNDDDSEKIKIKFDLDPKTQNGEYKKGGGLDILVIEEGKEPKDLQMYSGGETVRIVFSIVLSLAKLLSKRAGKKHETLIIDEKIAKLDTRGIGQFGEVISEISKIYKQVFVITHIENLKDLINGSEIIINKTDNEGSLVSVI